MREGERLDIIYSNVRVMRVVPDEAHSALTIMVTCAEREEQRMLYEGVLYSQLDSSVEGQRIAIAARVTPDALRGDDHSVAAARLLSECGLRSLDLLDEMERRGYRLFSHYIVGMEELIIIAKELRIG